MSLRHYQVSIMFIREKNSKLELFVVKRQNIKKNRTKTGKD